MPLFSRHNIVFARIENKKRTLYDAHMTTTLLTRRSHREYPVLRFLDGPALRLTRAHELCGPARRTLALMIAGALDGPVFWVQPSWMPDRLYPDGVRAFIAPRRLTFVTPKRPEDLLWVTEEVLRSGAVPLVVADLPGPPGLTAVRRLHLAAETGGEVKRMAPLALLMTPGDGGAPGIESRWHMTPAHHDRDSRWTLERRRARTEPPHRWDVAAQDGALRVIGKGQTIG